MNTGKTRASTVKVTIHIGASGSVAVGVITSEWQGAVRLDRRLARSRPIDGPYDPPPGVDRDVFTAFLALSDLVGQQRTDVGPVW